MNYFDRLPIELLHEIAGDSEPAYSALLAYPRFARAVTPGTRIDYMVGFGHDVHVYKDSIKWYRNGLRHRLNDYATAHIDGTKKWYQDGKHHREGGPALIYADGVKLWCRDNLLHREDGPAVTYPNGREAWYQDNLLHREDGPAVTHPDGRQDWYLYGIQHNDDDVLFA